MSSTRARIWTPDDLQAAASKGKVSIPLTHIDPISVPEVLHPLIPYAQVWGSQLEEAARNDMVDRMPSEAVTNLRDVVDEYQEQLLQWLAGPAAGVDNPTDAYVAFSALLMAGDYAPVSMRSRLRQREGPDSSAQ